MKTKSLTNLRYLEKATGGESKIMKEFIEMYFEQIPRFRYQLKLYLQNRQWKEMGNIARMAQATVLTFGMFDLSKSLRKLHSKANKRIGFDSYPIYINEFLVDTETAEIELREALRRLS